MARIYRHFPKVTPWIMILLFIQILIVQVDFRSNTLENQPLEIITEREGAEPPEPTTHWKKGVLLRLSTISSILEELDADEIPADGFPDQTRERLTRILFGQKLIASGLFFLCLLCVTSFLSWITQAWFRIYLNKVLHWIGIVMSLSSLGNTLPYSNEHGLALGLSIFYGLLFVFLVFSYRALNLGKPDSTRFEVLKHTSELDEEGKKPTQTIEMSPFRVAYHFVIIIIVGLAVGNFVYIPLFLLQKHYSYEFGILLVGLLGLLSLFYIHNYKKISNDEGLTSWQNTMASLSYLQYKFIKNLTMGIGVTLLVVVLVTILFTILITNAEVLKNPSLGIIEKSPEF